MIYIVIQLLDILKPKLEDSRFETAGSPGNQVKNRDQAIIPREHDFMQSYL